jgi:hypothetical protein
MRVSLASLLVLLVAVSAQAQPRLQVTKDQLKAEYAGICRNPDAAFPKPVPEEKKAVFAAWCSCVEQSIDEIPDGKLQQAAEETFKEYAQYKNDPRGFVPIAQYSLVRISKACIKK